MTGPITSGWLIERVMPILHAELLVKVASTGVQHLVTTVHRLTTRGLGLDTYPPVDHVPSLCRVQLAEDEQS
jgi:hypothetical protein